MQVSLEYDRIVGRCSPRTQASEWHVALLRLSFTSSTDVLSVVADLDDLTFAEVCDVSRHKLVSDRHDRLLDLHIMPVTLFNGDRSRDRVRHAQFLGHMSTRRDARGLEAAAATNLG